MTELSGGRLPDECLGAEHGEPDLDLSLAVAAEALSAAGRGADMMAVALAGARGASEGLKPVADRR